LASDVFSEQDATGILDKTKRLLDHLLRRYRGIVSIGLSGQMHGIVYYDREGAPVSPLINWQDKRADRCLENGETVCETILRMTGERIATGYGLATHYYNVKKGLVPPEAVGFGSIMDLFGMKICGLKRAVTHTSVAASFGLFDVKAGTFRTEALAALGIDPSLLPRVTSESAVIGDCEGIPVAVALGDNQASVLGSVKHNTDSLLVNIGTGSQISVVTACGEACGDMELRPFVEGEYLLCGSALSGGFAYAMLERFFQSYAIRAGLPEMAQYTLMNELAAEAYENGEPGLTVDVSFCGKRHDPHCRGKIEGMGRENFTPSALVLGVLKGMCHELWELSATLPEKKSHVVASGGAVRRNETLRRLIGDRFGTAVSVVAVEEEAATGAALFSAFCVGRISYCDGFSEYIRYE
jgi:sedoheptulokinase